MKFKYDKFVYVFNMYLKFQVNIWARNRAIDVQTRRVFFGPPGILPSCICP